MNSLLKVINFSEFKIFNENNGIYVYSIENNKIFEIDKKTELLLQQNGKKYEDICLTLNNVFSKKELDNLLKKMEDQNFIKNTNNSLKSKKFNIETSNISSITLMLIQKCNLKCSYCYGQNGTYNDSGVMSIETAQKSIDLLITKSKNCNLSICFFGGEPLLKFDLIKKIVSYCHKKETETDKRFRFTMTTNGTLLNKEIEEFIIENNIRLQISIDGNKTIHDSNRYFDNKRGSHDIILTNTKNLRSMGLLSARATITGKYMDIKNIYNYLSSLNFYEVSISPAFNLLTREEYTELAKSYIAFYLDMEKRIKEKRYKEVQKNKQFIKELKQIHYSIPRKVSCGAGITMNAVDIHGDIYPCHRFVNYKDYSIGTIWSNNSKQNTFLENTMFNNKKNCFYCWARNLCISGCPSTNLSVTGNTTSIYEPFCDYIKKVKEELIKIYLRLSALEINLLLNN
ncbi:SPASM domain-containing protein [Clostridium felsineum]|uniref:PapB family radical SAM/SPASM ranthipeptide maturase n=1 Tax=Clostridium felsineum TaxID=36839 RepID=UPI00214DCCE9|nr:radical SAM protein [Clostridium felsineum]MCR3758710.1 SPASM domain-containing protein [Clostridium felsineum]